MKKFLAVFVVLALTCMGSMAFAGDIAVSGSVDVRSRDFQDLGMNKNSSTGQVDTQERVRLNVNAKSDSDNVKAKLTIENDWDTWGRINTVMANGSNSGTNTSSSKNAGFLDLREAWVSFNMPGVPVNVTAGHQLLQLGNGWFLRDMKYGSDAWVVANVSGNNIAALVDIKAMEGKSNVASDDIDAYAGLDVFKIDDNNTVGIYVADVKDRSGATVGGIGKVDLQNIGLHYTGKLGGMLTLNAEADMQMGKIDTAGTDPKFKGSQIVIQGTLPIDPVTLSFTVARGSGNKASSNDKDGFINFMDADQHYTFLYEYKIKQSGAASLTGGSTGFSNTTAVGVGATSAVAKSVTIGASAWMLQATEKVADVKNGSGTTSALGTEIDATVNWQMYDSLSWNWNLGYLAPGAGLGKDAATGAQGVLTYKF